MVQCQFPYWIVAVLLAAFFCLPAWGGLQYPESQFWSEDRKSVLWGKFMADTVYDKCPPIADLEKKNPVSGADILALAHDYNGDGFLKHVAWDLGNYLKSTDEEDKKNNVNPYLPIILRVRIAFVVFCSSIAIFLIFFVLLCCRKCCGKLFCSMCCAFRKRLPLKESALLVKFLTFVLAVASLAGCVVIVGLSRKQPSNIKLDTERVLCQAYRLPYTLTFGSQYNQTEYLLTSGRENITVKETEKWLGAFPVLSELAKIKDVFAPAETVGSPLYKLKQSTTNFTTEFTAVTNEGLHAQDRLKSSLAKTKTSLQVLHQTTPHHHICLLCTSADGGSDGILLEQSRFRIKEIQADVNRFPDDVDQLSHDLQASGEGIDEMLNAGYQMFEGIPKLYQSLDMFEPYAEKGSRYVGYAIYGIIIFLMVVASAFTVGVGYTCFRYRNDVPKPSKALSSFLAFSWISLFAWTVVLLLVTSVLLVAVGLSAKVCLVADELLVKGEYENYPRVVEFMKKLLPTTTATSLKSILSFEGDGNLDSIMNITAIMDQIKTGIAEVSTKTGEVQDKEKDNLKEANLTAQAATVSAASWIVMLDIHSAIAVDPTYVAVPPEVLLSGLQLKKQALDEQSKSKIAPLLKGTGLQTPDYLYGFEDAETKINEQISLADPNVKLCFGTVTSCSTQGSSHRTVGATFDPATDAEIQKTRRMLGEVAYSKLLKSIKIMTWKLNILTAAVSPFTAVQKDNSESHVPYSKFMSPEKGSDAFVNDLIHQSSTKLNDVLAEKMEHLVIGGKEFTSSIDKLIDAFPGFRRMTRSILAEVFAIKDPVCRGVIQSFSYTSAMWVALAVFQIVLACVAFKFYHYLRDVQHQLNYSGFLEDEQY